VTPEKKKFPTIAKINNPITRSTATLARGPIDKIIVLIKALRPGLFPARRAILVTLRTRIIFVICPDDLALGPVIAKPIAMSTILETTMKKSNLC
jgi:hypothetical protein